MPRNGTSWDGVNIIQPSSSPYSIYSFAIWTLCHKMIETISIPQIPTDLLLYILVLCFFSSISLNFHNILIFGTANAARYENADASFRKETASTSLNVRTGGDAPKVNLLMLLQCTKIMVM